jgi:hypothetical protein
MLITLSHINLFVPDFYSKFFLSLLHLDNLAEINHF